MPDERERMMQRLFDRQDEEITSDHDLLIKLGGVVRTLSAITSDHESRIRNMERIVMWGAGAMGALKIVWDIVHK